MPYVLVQSIEGRTPEQKRKVAADITESMVENFGCPSDAIYVVFEDVAATDWVVGGVTVAELRRKRGG